MILYLVLLTTDFTHSAQGVEAQGTFSTEVYWAEGNTSRADREFSVNIGDGTWEITTKAASQTNGIKYNQSTFDGTNIFSFTAFDTNYNNGKTSRQSKNDSLGFVRTESFPPYDSSLIQPIWLAFCSGRYLKQFSNSLAPSFLGVGYPNTQLPFCQIRLETLNERFQIPKAIQVFNKGKVVLGKVAPVKQSRTNFTEIGETLADAPAPYNQGFLNAEYKVIEQTNFNGVVLPLRFEIDIFGMKANAASASDLQLVTRILGFINTVQMGEAPRMQPELGNRSLIYDKRVPIGPKEVAAYWPSNKWLSLNEVEHMVSTSDKYVKFKPRQRPFVALFGIVSIAGVVAIFMFSVKQKKNSKQTNQT